MLIDTIISNGAIVIGFILLICFSFGGTLYQATKNFCRDLPEIGKAKKEAAASKKI